MTSISKNLYIDKLDDIVHKYNNTYHSTIKLKSVKFKIGDIVRISKYKNIFGKGYVPNSSEEDLLIKKINAMDTVPWTYFISDVNGEKIVRTFYEKELQKKNQNKFRVEKVISRKSDKLYVKWKGYHSSFDSWIDKKGIVQMSKYFTEPKSLGRKVKVESDLSNYATKADLKNATGVGTSKFAKKVDLAN